MQLRDRRITLLEAAESEAKRFNHEDATPLHLAFVLGRSAPSALDAALGEGAGGRLRDELLREEVHEAADLEVVLRACVPTATDAEVLDVIVPHVRAQLAGAAPLFIPASARAWRPGDVILGTYEVIGVAGEGGMGRVYRVHHRQWDRDLAVKRMLPERAFSERLRAAFEHEAQLWVQLELHPNVCACHYVRRVDGVPHIFVEYVGGGSLRDRVRDGSLYVGGPAQILGAAIGAARGLAHAHAQGVAHRDVKPANVLLDADGVAKVSDFGIARVVTATGEAPVSNAAATRAYRSPEQARAATADVEVTTATDVWSLAVSLLELYSGASLSDGVHAPHALGHRGRLALPERVSALLARCLVTDPAARPWMTDVARELEAIYALQTGDAYDEPLPGDATLAAGELSNRALSMLDLGRPEQAERAWEEALERDPAHPQATFNRGLYRWRAGQITDDELVRTLEFLRGTDWTASYLLGLVHHERGDREAALARLAAASEYASDAQHVAERAEELARCVASRQLGRYVESAAMTPDGSLAVIASDGTVHLWWNLVSLGTLDDVGTVASVAVSDAGRVLLGTEGGAAIVWDPDGLRRLEGHDALVHAVALRPDGALALSGCREGKVRIWDVQRGTCLHALDGHRDAVTGAAVRAHVAVTASFDGELRVWGPDSGECLRAWQAHGDWIWGLAVSRDGRRALTGSQDGTACLWDLERGELQRRFDGGSGNILSVALTHDARLAVTGDSDGRMRIWDAERGRCRATLTHAARLGALAITSNAHRVVSGDQEGNVRLWRLQPDADRAVAFAYTTPRPSREVVEAAARLRDALSTVDEQLAAGRFRSAVESLRALRQVEGQERHPELLTRWRRAARGGYRGPLHATWPALEVRAHDVELPERYHATRWGATKELRYLPLASTAGPRHRVRAVTLAPDGRRAVTAGDDARARVWELETGHAPYTLVHSAWAISTALLPDGRVLTGSQDGRLWLWDLEGGRLARRIDAHTDALAALAVSRDGRIALSGSFDRTARVWDIATGECLRTFEDQRSPVALTTRLALTSGTDAAVYVWDLATGERIRSLPHDDDFISSLAAAPGGRVAITGTRQALHVWDLRTGRRIRHLDHDGNLTAAAISDDGTIGLTGTMHPGVTRVWDLRTGACLAILGEPVDGIGAVALTPDARHALAGDDQGTLRAWTLDWDIALA